MLTLLSHLQIWIGKISILAKVYKLNFEFWSKLELQDFPNVLQWTLWEWHLSSKIGFIEPILRLYTTLPLLLTTTPIPRPVERAFKDLSSNSLGLYTAFFDDDCKHFQTCKCKMYTWSIFQRPCQEKSGL